MSYSFACPRCGKPLTVEASMAGKERICPHPDCRATIRAPAKSAARPTTGGGATDHALLLFPSGRKGPENLIDMTAMVDIVFFLLIFFMVTSIQALESVIELPAPQASSSTPSIETAPDYANDPSVVFITIEADDAVWVNEERVFGGQDLRVKLRKLRKDGLESIFVLGHPEASHGMLVMVLDAGTDAGMSDVRFSVSENLEVPTG